MASGGERQRRRASLPEVVGAWLRVWTPPRDVEVPPVPVRRLAIGGFAALVLIAAAAALIAPRIDESKERTAAAEARERGAALDARRRRIIAQQQPRRGEA